MDFKAKEVDRIDHPRRVSLEPNVVLEPSTEEKGGNQPSVRDTKRARGGPIPSANETLTTPEMLA